MEVRQLVCHHCNVPGRIRRHGQARSGIQRYLCVLCKKTFQVSYIYQGHEVNIAKQIKSLLAEGQSREQISRSLGVSLKNIDRHIYMLESEAI
ncbi:IS1 family transposase [Budviciaceae bacterium CWB-B4]|uniref:IS1 family transposase n=1 Tax=Limnobaculum xujianqingii TaxID=2738837 RepID=A0A9D7AHA6_9GAMM|nr:hypothetical protein [Limnobaculum xujianqingii]MBK5072714.1 IS1 family transposase [Limnobaculum xujianqingii]MBK5176023.1 IS1 family transposase [Limnobaculum xujianqingii]